MKKIFESFLIIVSSVVLRTVSCQCTVPDDFLNKSYDSLTSSSDIDFSDGNSIVWPISIYGETFLWKCISSGSGYLFLRSEKSVDTIVGSYFIYACLQFTKISDSQLYYYLLNKPSAQSRIAARIFQSTEGLLRLCQVCDYDSVTSDKDYFVMSSSKSNVEVNNAKLGTDPCTPVSSSPTGKSLSSELPGTSQPPTDVTQGSPTTPEPSFQTEPTALPSAEMESSLPTQMSEEPIRTNKPKEPITTPKPTITPPEEISGGPLTTPEFTIPTECEDVCSFLGS